MNDKVLLKMRKAGIAHRKSLEKAGINDITPIFSVGESAAFKFWSIARAYDHEIIVDELPEQTDLKDFLWLYRTAKISSIIITGEAVNRTEDLRNNGCIIGDYCKVFVKAYPDSKERTVTVRGLRVFL